MATGDNDGSSGAALLNQPIVMDIGTDTTKAGFAGGQTPKVRWMCFVHVVLLTCVCQ